MDRRLKSLYVILFQAIKMPASKIGQLMVTRPVTFSLVKS